MENSTEQKVVKPLTEGRIALIAVLISIPSAFLIAMLIHYFVEIPEQSPFSSETVIVSPVHHMPAAKMENKPNRMKATPKRDLKSLYLRKIELCKANHAAAKSALDILNTNAAYLLAEGELFRYENGIRRWGNSITDLAVRAEKAKRIAVLQKTVESEIAAVDQEIQLKSHRIFKNQDWQNAYAAYQKDPGLKTYRAMLEAEQAAQPPRKF